MNRSYLFLGALLLALFALLYLLRPPGGGIDWRESYDPTALAPYGTAVLEGLLDDQLDELRVFDGSVAAELPLDSTQRSSYLFVGQGMYLDSADVGRLLDYVDLGNRVFISSKTLPQELLYPVYEGECDDTFWEDYTYIIDTVAPLRLDADGTTTTYRYVDGEGTRPYRWHYAEFYLFCDYPYSLEVLGTLDERVNFFAMRYGAGSFYFHATPLAFTNYHLRDSSGLRYADRVLDYLPTDAPLYYDNASRTRESVARARNRETPRLDAESPLRYILAQPPLAWAWYLLLAMGLLYLIFGARRRQRAIPVLARPENSSLAFVETIGRLNYARGNHVRLAGHLMTIFLGEVRERYRLPAGLSGPDLQQQLAKRAGVAPELVRRLFQLHDNIQRSRHASDRTLEDFHRLIRTFHQASQS